GFKPAGDNLVDTFFLRIGLKNRTLIFMACTFTQCHEEPLRFALPQQLLTHGIKRLPLGPKSNQVPLAPW
ncbi:hypothetical protein, partial [Halovibrio variabilis]|uniref:hypothetical protein n=1 Tax=Halovibrio variabilis TaxID=31910 RepID=UPI001C3F6AE4